MSRSDSEALFLSAFSAPPDHVVETPGRVNLIGEHIDYNGGLVLPMALPLGLTIALSARTDDRIRIVSEAFEGVLEARLGAGAASSWADYAIGAVIYAQQVGYLGGGADLAITSTLPMGAGLSSSSALTVGVLRAACQSAGITEAPEALARLARRIENEYIGVPCGIMDQMAVAIAAPRQALALDTRTLAYETISVPTGLQVAVLHSGQYRALSDGQYKVRKQECDAAKALLETDDLCLVRPDHPGLAQLPEPISRRVRHCRTEHARSVEAAALLARGDGPGFGALMTASHVSMRYDFEVSLPAIDALVETALGEGALGARLTGGGFGGCIVALVARETVPDWRASVLGAHPDAFWVC